MLHTLHVPGTLHALVANMTAEQAFSNRNQITLPLLKALQMAPFSFRTNISDLAVTGRVKPSASHLHLLGPRLLLPVFFLVRILWPHWPPSYNATPGVPPPAGCAPTPEPLHQVFSLAGILLPQLPGSSDFVKQSHLSEAHWGHSFNMQPALLHPYLHHPSP